MGFWHWGGEYADHVFPPYYKKAKCRGIDFFNETAGLLVEPVLNQKGTQSAAVFVEEFDRVVSSHSANTPLYAYLAFQNAHDPYEQAPAGLVAGYDERMDVNRRNFSAIVEDLDMAVGKIVGTLQSHGLWNNTILFFTSDNGGELPFADQSKCGTGCLTTGCCGGAGNNHPLRGGKFTLFEGGIRSRAFISGRSAMLPNNRRGTTWAGMGHVSDLFATIGWLAGAQVSELKTSGAPLGSAVNTVPTDGFNLWESISNNGTSPRQELVHQPLNQYWNGSCPEGHASNPFRPSCGASITVWPFKLFLGFPGDARVVKVPRPGLKSPSQAKTPLKMCVGTPCLFNVEEDASESRDLASQQPEKVAELRARLLELSVPEAGPQPPDALTPEPSDAACREVEATGAWQPWVQSRRLRRDALVV